MGALYDTHHGLTNAVFMPYVLRFNRPVIESKCSAIARYLDLANPSFEALLGRILELRSELNIPHRLSELILDGGYSTLDLSRFGCQRVVDDRPDPERGFRA